MVILHQLWLRLQLINVVDGFLGWWACREKFAWGAIDSYCVGVVVPEDGDKWNPIEAVLLAPPAQDSTS